MKRVAIACLVAGCASPAPSSLNPRVQVEPDGSRLHVATIFDGDPDIPIKATFRGTTRSLPHTGTGGYSVNFDLAQPPQGDEPLDIDIDGIAMTMTAPPDFGEVDVPLFISRSKDATISWTQVSPDPIFWYVLSSACVVTSSGGDIPPDAPSVTFTAADWMNPNPAAPPATGTCTTDVRLIRNRATPIDPAFAGGGLTFEQIYDALFASTP